MILEHILKQEPLRRHEHELTFMGAFFPDDPTSFVIKITRAPNQWQQLMLPQRATHWRPVSAPQVSELGLDAQHTWIAHARPWLEGTPLPEVDLTTDWKHLMVAVTQRLAALHSAHTPHGDLKPDHVIVRPDASIEFIDLPLFAVSPNDHGQVVGSAPLMAPELWSGHRPTLASDVYALGCMLAWAIQGRWPLEATGLAGWADAHQRGAHLLRDDAFDRNNLRGVIERMLSHDAGKRPPLQQVIDALIAQGARPPEAPRASLASDSLRGFAQDLVASLDEASAVGVIGHPDMGSARALGHVEHQLRLQGREVWRLEGGRFCASLGSAMYQPEADSNPWRPLLDLVHAQTGDSTLAPTPGDESHVFDWFTRQIQAFEQGAVMVWRGVDAASADVRAWLEQRGRSVPLVYSSTHALGIADNSHVTFDAIPQPDQDAWNAWRATHPDARVRDLSAGEWARLFDAHGDRVEAMLRAVESLDLKAPFEPVERPQEALSEQMRQAMEYRAYRDVLAMARQLPQQDHTPETLDLWTRAALQAQVTPEQLAELAEALSAHAVRAPTARVARWQVWSRMGQHALVLQDLDDLAPDAAPGAPWDAPPWSWAWRRWRAQASLSMGQFDRAGQVAQQALEAMREASLEPSLANEDIAYLRVLSLAGRAMGADAGSVEALLALGPQLEDAGAPALLCAKCYGYAALGLARMNQLDASTDAHLRALEYVEREGLRAELPVYLLNVGTSYHRQGRLGLAREYYARGTRMARDSGRASTQALLLVNQANIDMVLGRFEEASALIERARALAQDHGMAHIHVATLAFEGYILHKRGDSAGALRFYDTCLTREDGMSDKLRAELVLQRAEVFVDQGAQARAHHALREARALIEARDLDDLRNTHGILSARVQWLDGSSVGRMGGIELFRRHLELAQKAGDHKLILQQSPHLIGYLEREELAQLREEIVDLARSARNAVAMGLTRELRQDFFASLPSWEAQPVAEPAPATQARAQRAPGSSDMERFYRMLSLNEVILKTQDLPSLWPTALEIAMSLSGAERGFLLLRDPSQQASPLSFSIAASRDVDASPIAQPHLNVSLTIAQEAAQTGRTVVTLNAREDRRFNVALSVVDLDLTSVLCVPVRDAHEVLGALYLDHRVHPGVFGGEVPRMMEAFGHQLALAITRARQLEALRAERARLRDAQRELQALLDERDLRLEHMGQRLEHMAQEVQRRQADAGLQRRFKDIAFVSTVMERALAHADRVATSDIPVVVHGESGTGKELVARAIHEASPRSGGPFVAFNCGAISATLFESEMFGHVKGAFTGAHMAREGILSSANGGTIFLDEVAEMPLEMQAKMLRVLQERRVRPVGAAQTQPIDVRIVCATHQDLRAMVAAQTFREDLYYRLAGFVIELPALRQRREDIPLIAHTLLQRIAPKVAGRPLGLSPEAGVFISGLPWPGNVRQLENALSAACVMAQGDVLHPTDFAMLAPPPPATPSPDAHMVPDTTLPKPPSKRGRRPKATRREIIDALERAQGDRDQAAQRLGVSLRTLYRYMSAHDLHDLV